MAVIFVLFSGIKPENITELYQRQHTTVQYQFNISSEPVDVTDFANVAPYLFLHCRTRTKTELTKLQD